MRTIKYQVNKKHSQKSSLFLFRKKKKKLMKEGASFKSHLNIPIKIITFSKTKKTKRFNRCIIGFNKFCFYVIGTAPFVEECANRIGICS